MRMNQFLLATSLLVMALVPHTAVAETTIDVSSAEEFQTAIDNLAESIRFTADFESTGTTSYVIDKNLKIDLNGHSVALSGTLLPRNNISLTIDDLSPEKKGELKSTGKSLITKAVPGGVVIKNGTLTSEGIGYPIISILKDGSCTIEGGCITGAKHSYTIENEGVLNINGGTLVGCDYFGVVRTFSEGVTEMTDGAIYAGFGAPTCFETEIYEDPNWGTEIATLKLPEGVHDGGAIVLDQKWAMPGVRYINYNMPEGAQMSLGHHYYTPGEEQALPGCDYFNNIPFAGWSKTSESDENLLTAIDASMDEDLQLYPVWKYLDIAPGVTINMIPESIDPAPGSTVESLSSVTLYFGEAFSDLYPKEDAETYGYVFDTLLGTRMSDVTISTGWDGDATVTLTTPITQNGTYELFIPGGVIGNDDYYYDDYQGGSCNPDLRYKYTIANAPTEPDHVVVDPADGSTVDRLKTIKFTYVDEETVCKNYDKVATLKDADGNIVYELQSGDAEYSETEDNAILLSLPEELTAAGVYTLHLPTGFFAFDYWVRDSYELTLTYTVTGNSGIESPESDRMRIRGDVYNLLGHKVLTDADMQQIRKLPSGIYIVNGKKVMVR